MRIDLPEDAAGREIPLDTEVLYTEDGKRLDVDRFTYSAVQTIPDHKWGVVFMDCRFELCRFSTSHRRNRLTAGRRRRRTRAALA